MRRKICIIAVAVGLPLLTAIVLLASMPKEPSYDGKPLSYWVNPPPNATSRNSRRQKLDSRALPFLILTLQRRDGWIQESYIKVAPRLPHWIQSSLPTSTPAWWFRSNAAALLGEMGTNSRPAIPGLIHVLEKDEHAWVRTLAAEALAKIDKSDERVKAALIEAAGDKDLGVRAEAINAIRPAAPDIPQLKQF
jgi:HEAT repeat protein